MIEVDRRAMLLALSSSAVPAGQGDQVRSDGRGSRDPIDPAQFGARYDGVTDDTAALQEAIDACAKTQRWRDLVVSGPLLVTKSVMIDRPVDRSAGIFQIFGASNGHIHIRGDAPLFDSRIAMLDHPVSEYIRITGLSISGFGTSIFSGKFLRIQIDNCFIMKTSIMITRKYVQSIEISKNRFIGAAKDELISARDGYDVIIMCNHFERTNKVVSIDNVNGIAIHNNVFESCASTVIEIDGVNGLTFSGNYTEANAGPTIVLGAKLGKSRGISIFGNSLRGLQNVAQNTHFEIVLGRAEGVASGGNYCSGNLYDTSYVRLGALCSTSDAVQGKLTSTDYPVAVTPAGVAPKPASVDLSVGSQAPAVSAPVTIVRTKVDATSQVQLPISVSDGNLRTITLINEGPGPLAVRVPKGSAFIGAGRADRSLIDAGSARSFMEYARGKWCVL